MGLDAVQGREAAVQRSWAGKHIAEPQGASTLGPGSKTPSPATSHHQPLLTELRYQLPKCIFIQGPRPTFSEQPTSINLGDSKSRTSPGIYLGEELLGHRVAADSALVPVLKGLHKVMMSSAMYKNSSCFLCLPTPGRSVCLILDGLVTGKWHVIMVLLCIFLMSEDVGPFPHAYRHLEILLLKSSLRSDAQCLLGCLFLIDYMSAFLQAGYESFIRHIYCKYHLLVC